MERLGFQRGLIERRVPRGPRGAAMVREQWHTMVEDLVLGVPSVVCMKGEERGAQRFGLLLGYSARTGKVTYHDPARPDGAHRQLPLSTFLRRWPIAYSSARRQHVVRIRLERDAAPTRSRAGAITAADYAQHIARLRRRLPDRGFTIVLQPPFVVVGDEDPARRVRERARTTVGLEPPGQAEAGLLCPRSSPEIIDGLAVQGSRRTYLRHARAAVR